MNREIKFRVWDGNGRFFEYFNLQEIPHGCATCVAPPQQFTGLKDKNDKEIYEGDVVCIPENDPTSTSGNAFLTVEYRYGGFGYVDLMTKKFENIYYLIGDVDVDDCAEVIGNVFENPELLENI